MLAALLCFGGCAKLQQSKLVKDVQVLMGPAPKANETPMQVPLACLAQFNTAASYRLGVADFVDATGVMEGGTANSRAFNQRADMMMVVALSRGGAHLVNRNSTNVSEWELRNAMEKKLGDGRPVVSENQTVEFRPVRAGSMLGSTHYVSGAITELNWNISSSVGELGAYSLGLGKRTYRISIAIDVMLTDTVTTEVVHARSYKKQLVGYETSAGFFRFMSVPSASSLVGMSDQMMKSLEVFNTNIGDKQNEPQQAALRWLIELSAYDLLRSISGRGERCDRLLPPGTLQIKPARQSIRPSPGSMPVVPSLPTGAPVPQSPMSSPAAPLAVPEPMASRQAAPQAADASAARSDTIKPRTSVAVIARAASESEAAAIAIRLQASLAPQLESRRLQILPRAVQGTIAYFIAVPNLDAREASILCFRVKVTGNACESSVDPLASQRNA